jgi:flagellar hook-length control protein FliK
MGIKKQVLTDAEGGERKSRLSDVRKNDRRSVRVSREVQDTRSAQGVEAAAKAGRETGPIDEARPSGPRETALTVELRSGNRDSGSASAGGPKTASQAFEDILARELYQNLNGDIVRHASVALKDGGEGTIRLSLRPESLGNVKIRLEMADNKITGHIIVETDEALRAFEREVTSLEQAFKDSGFEGADLDMSLASGDSGGEQQRGEGEASPFFSERFAAELAASRYDAALTDLERTDTPWTGSTVNGITPGNGQISVNMLI